MKKTVLLLAACALIAAAGCQSATKTKPKAVHEKTAPRPKLQEIAITPSAPKVELGKSITLKAIGFDGDMAEMLIEPQWSMGAESKIGSLKPEVGREVVFTAKKMGTTLLTAEVHGISASVKVEVTKAPGKTKKRPRN